MKRYKRIKTGVYDNKTEKHIPNDPANRDWRRYQLWIEQGNSPDPEYTTDELAEIKKKEKRKTDVDAAIKAIYDFYKDKKKSDITDAHIMELAKLEYARKWGLEI